MMEVDRFSWITEYLKINVNHLIIFPTKTSTRFVIKNKEDGVFAILNFAFDLVKWWSEKSQKE